MPDEIKNVFISHIHEDDEGLSALKDLVAQQGMEIRDSSITADTIAIGLSVSAGSGTVNLAGAVGVASATNSIGGSTQALITNGSSLDAGGTVALSLSDTASITSNGGASAAPTSPTPKVSRT